MSDQLVQFQDWIAQYPTWMVAAGIGFVVVVAVILIWKALRIALIAFIVAVVVGAGWYLWDSISKRKTAPAAAPVRLIVDSPGQRPT